MIVQQKRAKLFLSFVALLLTLSLATAGCGSTPTPTPEPIFALEVSPGTEVPVGRGVAIVAKIEPLEKLDLKWSVSGTAGGRLNTDRGEQVVYTAGQEGVDIVVAEGTTASGMPVKQTVSLTVVGEPMAQAPVPPDTPTHTLAVTSTPTDTPTDTPTPTLTPTATPTDTPTPTPDAVVRALVNLRRGPGTGYDIITTMSPGQVLSVTGRNNDATWLQASTDQGQEGWVATDYVTLNQSIEQIPIVTPPPPPEPGCVITNPTDGEQNLGYENRVSGNCSNVLVLSKVWILVYSYHDSRYYPQPGPVGEGSGPFEGMAYLGEAGAGVGYYFDIIVALAETADLTLPSPYSLPDWIIEADRIEVRRGH
jgi:hypothetical protein